MAMDRKWKAERSPDSVHLLAQRMESHAALATGIAHDLMGVLASISMSLEFLASKAAPDDAWVIEALSEGVKRGQEGVRQVNWLASAREGERIYFDPLHLVKEARKLVAQAFPGVAVSADYPPEVGLVHTDPALLRQLFIGLCLAACARQPAPGRLVLRASRSAGDPSRAEGASILLAIEGAAPAAETDGPEREEDWRDRQGMDALVDAFEALGGKVEAWTEGPVFRARVEVPLAAPPESA
jgi:signal transduction histidine kinase